MKTWFEVKLSLGLGGGQGYYLHQAGNVSIVIYEVAYLHEEFATTTRSILIKLGGDWNIG